MRATPSVVAASRTLTGPARRQYERQLDALRARGCRAGGYRLLDDDGEPSAYCGVHIYRDWRLIATFEDRDVILVALGQHDGPGFYRELAAELGTGAVGQRRSAKPACCGAQGWPSVGVSRSAG